MKKIFIAFLLIITSAFSFFLGFKLNKQKVLQINEEAQNTSVSICDEYLSTIDDSVTEIYQGDTATVNFDSLPEAKLYQTNIADQVATGPNFAGHYTVATWGCGTECQGFAIVDNKTGDIIKYQPVIEFRASSGLSYSINSNILIFNAKSYNQDYLDSIQAKPVKEILENDSNAYEASKARIYYVLQESSDGSVFLSDLCVENILDGEF